MLTGRAPTNDIMDMRAKKRVRKRDLVVNCIMRNGLEEVEEKKGR